ncbi:cytochrome P450 [Lentinus tigrinus ALCF2SS1-7]|uniref:Cytochrome P450 n=1 Tax=Lentinus tigrinus ALCF2SS1-6 TaxID=1328759 RepID=A0A5C2SEB2_9APHY|nr:cytochrome P450 [Lentinus tigrinus ALCF2SS1-6]RPD76142.1 cytochrome P450 [Lentinus tigrinus ALCF2SS1-7]
MSLVDLLFLLLLGILAYVWSAVRWRRRSRGLSFPPGPTGLPVLGNMFDIPIHKPWYAYRDLCSKYGDILHFRIFGQSIVVLGSADIIRESLNTGSTNTASRKQTIMLELTGESLNFGFMPYGRWWSRHRRAFWQHFDRDATIASGPIQRDMTHKFLERLLKDPSNLKEHMRFAFGRSVLKLAYGIDVSAEKDEYLAVMDETLEGASEGLVPRKFLVEYLPFLRYIQTWFPGARPQRLFAKWQQAAEKLKDMPYDCVRKCMESGTEAPQCIMSDLIAGLPHPREPSYHEEEDIVKNVCATAFLAGSDTMVSTLLGAFVALSLYPDVQKKAQAELDAVVGPDRLPDYSDQDSLVYIGAIVREALRWHIVDPLGLPHCTIDDDELYGYFIPAGTVLLPNMWAIMHDPETYPDTEAFRPERYIRDGKIGPTIRDPLSLVFGFGRRICPGRYFALAGLFVNIASVLHVFYIGPPVDGGGRPVEVTPGMTDGAMSYPEDARCTIKPRSPKAEALILDSARCAWLRTVANNN